jgi:hypothetical protein
VRERVIEWYRSTLLSRGDDKTKTRIVVVMQRVHTNDLVGYLQEQGGFEVLNLPAIAPKTQTYELGGDRTYSRQYGELLHPEHEPVDELLDLKRRMGPIAFSAQYQQSPIPPGGTIIKRKWLTTYDYLGIQPGDRIVISWDIALSEMETGDYSAGVVVLIRNEVFYVLEVVRGRFPFETLKKKIMDLKKRYHPSTLLIEESPISLSSSGGLRSRRAGDGDRHGCIRSWRPRWRGLDGPVAASVEGAVDHAPKRGRRGWSATRGDSNCKLPGPAGAVVAARDRIRVGSDARFGHPSQLRSRRRSRPPLCHLLLAR